MARRRRGLIAATVSQGRSGCYAAPFLPSRGWALRGMFRSGEWHNPVRGGTVVRGRLVFREASAPGVRGATLPKIWGRVKKKIQDLVGSPTTFGQGELAAGGGDIAAAVTPDGGSHAVRQQIFLERAHRRLRGLAVGKARAGVERNQIHLRAQRVAVDQRRQPARVARRVVHAG